MHRAGDSSSWLKVCVHVQYFTRDVGIDRFDESRMTFDNCSVYIPRHQRCRIIVGDMGMSKSLSASALLML